MRHILALPLSVCLMLATLPARADDPVPMKVTPPGAEQACAGHDLLRPIMATHTMPPYPQVSVMTSEQGTTLLQVSIAADGVPSDAQIVTSSGSLRLDEAARDFVKANWKWQPPLKDCKPIAVTTRVSINWSLHNGPSAGGLGGLSPSLLLDVMTIKIADASDYPASLPALTRPAMTMLMVMVNASGKASPVAIGQVNPVLAAKAVEIAQAYHWPQARMDAKPIGAIYALMVVWPVPGQPVPKADDIKSVMSLLATSAPPAAAAK